MGDCGLVSHFAYAPLDPSLHQHAAITGGPAGAAGAALPHGDLFRDLLGATEGNGGVGGCGSAASAAAGGGAGGALPSLNVSGMLEGMLLSLSPEEIQRVLNGAAHTGELLEPAAAAAAGPTTTAAATTNSCNSTNGGAGAAYLGNGAPPQSAFPSTAAWFNDPTYGPQAMVGGAHAAPGGASEQQGTAPHAMAVPFAQLQQQPQVYAHQHAPSPLPPHMQHQQWGHFPGSSRDSSGGGAAGSGTRSQRGSSTQIAAMVAAAAAGGGGGGSAAAAAMPASQPGGMAGSGAGFGWQAAVAAAAATISADSSGRGGGGGDARSGSSGGSGGSGSAGGCEDGSRSHQTQSQSQSQGAGGVCGGMGGLGGDEAQWNPEDVSSSDTGGSGVVLPPSLLPAHHHHHHHAAAATAMFQPYPYPASPHRLPPGAVAALTAARAALPYGHGYASSGGASGGGSDGGASLQAAIGAATAPNRRNPTTLGPSTFAVVPAAAAAASAGIDPASAAAEAASGGHYLSAVVQQLAELKLQGGRDGPAGAAGAGAPGGGAVHATAVVVSTQTERRAAVSAAASHFMSQSDQVVRELLLHLGFTESQADSAINGSMGDLSEAAANVVNMVLRLKASVLSLYIRHLEKRPDAADGPAGLGLGGGGGGLGSMGGDGDGEGDGDTLQAGAATLTHLRLRGGVAESLVALLRSKLKSSACQLWALANIVDPRPPRHIKLSLAQYTGKTPKQVTDWFTNWRARHWRPTIMALDVQVQGAGGEGRGANGGVGGGAGVSRTGKAAGAGGRRGPVAGGGGGRGLRRDRAASEEDDGEEFGEGDEEGESFDTMGGCWTPA